jgi:hypothetical protein
VEAEPNDVDVLVAGRQDSEYKNLIQFKLGLIQH